MQVPVPDQEGDWQGAGKSAWGFVGCTGFSSKGRWPLRRVTRVLLRPQRALESPCEGRFSATRPGAGPVILLSKELC